MLAFLSPHGATPSTLPNANSGDDPMARPASKFAVIQNDKSRDELVTLWKTHPLHYTRVRAHAILLSGQEYTVKQITEIFGVDRDSVASWIDRFNTAGAASLEDDDRPGASPGLDEEEQAKLRDLFKRFPNRPSHVRSELEKVTGKSVCRETIRRYAKRFGLSWKRFRRNLRKMRDEKAFRVAQAELAELLAEPDLDVVYFDESGFSVKGVIPYGWTTKGERASVPITGNRGSSVQVLGLKRQDGGVNSYLHKGTVNSEIVISVLDDYSSQLVRTTVVVLDNSPCHTSGAFSNRLEEWKKRGLLVYFLPPYSPELNGIEPFWKKLKYQLLSPGAWEKFRTLIANLTSKLVQIGETTYLPSMQNYAE